MTFAQAVGAFDCLLSLEHLGIYEIMYGTLHGHRHDSASVVLSVLDYGCRDLSTIRNN